MTARRMTSDLALRALAVTLGGCAVLGGCTVVGPDYVRPDLDVPAQTPGGSAQSDAAEPVVAWWRQFGDPELDLLVDEAVRQNLDLSAAEARMRALRAVARASGAPGRPRMDAGADWFRERFPENRSSFGNGTSVTTGGDPDDAWSATLGASWEIDLFGRIRRGEQAAEAEAFAAEQDVYAVLVAVVAATADAWFDVGEADAREAVLTETADLLTKTLDVVRARVESGIVNEIDQRRVEGDLAAARSRIPVARQQRREAENRLSVLLGRPPGVRPRGRAPGVLPVPPAIPTGIPATLLERRPDVRAAEARLVATNARVGAAMADFYPRLTILGRAGFAGDGPDDFDWASRLWSIGPQVSLPILDGGQREWAQIEAEARRDEATAQYVAVFVRALAEVADGLSGFGETKVARDAVVDAVTAAERAVEIADVLYREGVTSYLELLDAQRALATSRLDRVSAERNLLREVVRVNRALGGGW